VPAASYRRNFPRATVLERSIRDVTAKEIMEACGVGPGELDVLDGSPPCTSFSTAGLRAKTWGKKRVHAGVEQRIDDLFFDYARLLEEIRPRTFIAENVAGLYRGAAIGYFKAILRVFRQCGYVVHVKLLDADLLGVPQHRERVIFVGVRSDVADSLDIDQAYVRERLFPKPLPYQYTVRDALPWLDPASDAYSLQGTPFGTPERIANGTATPPERVKPADVAPAATLLAGGHGRAGVQVAVVQDPRGIHPAHGDVTDTQAPTIRTTDQGQWKVVTTDDGGTVYRRKFSILEVKRLCSFPDDFELEGKFNEQWAQLGNSVPPVMMRAVAERLRDGVFKRLK
jgi:DNA (cytosine-5)-methyltransferase 1